MKMNFKKLLIGLERQEGQYEEIKMESKKLTMELDDLMKEALELNEEAVKLLEKRKRYEEILEDKDDADIEEKLKENNEVIDKVKNLINKIEGKKNRLINMEIEYETKRKEYKKSLDKLKLIVKKAIEIQNLGLQYYFLAFLYILTGILTVVQRDYFLYIQSFINDIDPLLKGYLLLAVISLIGGTIIYSRSVNDAEKHLQNKTKITFWRVIKLPNIFELGAFTLITIYLFFPNLIGLLLSNEFGILVVIFINSILITIISLQIRDLLLLIFFKFNRTITDPKDRLTAIVAIMGTTISLIALFK